MNARALHYVLKIGDRARNAHFFRNILGMQVLRHEEFNMGCDAQCNGPYDNRWSKTMVGYGAEASHFVIELTYNYGVSSYEMGNDFGGIYIKSNRILERANSNSYPVERIEKQNVIKSPDGYKFIIIAEEEPLDDPVLKVVLHSTDLEKSIYFWNKLLKMDITAQDDSIHLTYGPGQCQVQLKKVAGPLNRAKAYGRIAFACPYEEQPNISKIMEDEKQTILTPLISLPTPDKATVRVIILADPDGHEICFVDDEGFSELSEIDLKSNAALDKYMRKDPHQEI